MRIDASQMQTVEQFAKQSTFKHLSQPERKAVQAVRRALHLGQDFVEIQHFDKEKLDQLISNLQKKEPKQPSSTTQRIRKGLENVFGGRVSSAKLKEEPVKYGRLKQLAKNIESQQYHQVDSMEAKRHADTFVGPVAEEQAQFFKKLSMDPAKARDAINARIENVEKQKAALKSSDPDLKDKSNFLESTVIKSLRKLRDCKADRFAFELKLQRQAWSNSAKNASNLPKQFLQESQKSLKSLAKEQTRLEKELGIPGAKKQIAHGKEIESKRNLNAKEDTKANARREYLREVDIRLADEMQQVWSRIRRTPKSKDIVANAIRDVDEKIGSLQAKEGAVDKGKLTSLRQFKKELEAVKDYDPFDRKAMADNLYQALSAKRDRAQDEIQQLRFQIARREGALEQLKTKK